VKTKLFQRDFTMVVVGQIISLFGNNVLRYALPLYLLNQTHSAALFGAVSACAFLPMIALAPVGGLAADRVNKRNIMVILDFSTAALIAFYAAIFESAGTVALLVAVLMLLYGIQGAYQPAVQSSIPALVAESDLMAGNAVINLVNSLAGLVGPVLGGVLFGFWGLRPVLLLSVVCFTFSAVMELFIRIPFEKQSHESGVFATAAADMKESFRFIRRDCPTVGRAGLVLAGINLVFSSLIIIGLPVVICEHLGFSQSVGDRLYGYAEGALAAGGLIGGMLAGTVGRRLDIRRAHRTLLLCTLTLLPIGLVLLLRVNALPAFFVLASSCLVMMALSTLLSIQLMAYVQKITPPRLIGKVTALCTCLVMCAHPVGQALYGVLFERFASGLGWLFFLSFAACLPLCAASKRIFDRLPA
jgi:MFS family permease